MTLLSGYKRYGTKKKFDQNCDFVKFSTSMFVFKCREKKYKNLKSSSRFTSPNSSDATGFK